MRVTGKKTTERGGRAGRKRKRVTMRKSRRTAEGKIKNYEKP
jgi:hypothetical protein